MPLYFYENPAEYPTIYGGDECGAGVRGMQSPSSPLRCPAIHGEELHLTGEVQLVNYLNGLKKEIGLLINFGLNGVDIRRKYRQLQQVT